ncbi:ATP-dependent helicase HrpB [Microvirga sp. STR05]|uniref:ATP-dependent helicase HrpB n=1 Tax=Hymenobacter duratus TaxID=2771356 RepID=A0ABR8JCM0_9BACT|nr:ATP-dependent helicase HrpB [Hymenobacter duratus]MBD2714544.1 ATP-dependent helicase HrpB [Hymenobacter duratus]MBR7949448.1 ATP-dependent helicase HrpB [Microvirga sp. STR05]
MKFPYLPIVAALPGLLTALAAHERVVLQAPPGAGKTTVVPLALLDAAWRAGGKILMLEPRQLAARAAATRLAKLLGEPVGETVGYRVRLESKVSDRTRIEVITEGILTRLIQDDPALEGVAAVIFDEFHERSLRADLGLALALDAQAVLRPELRILVMSATLEAERMGTWLQAPVVSSAGFLFPVETHYLNPRQAAAGGSRPTERLATLVPTAVREALRQHPDGDLLVFLPGLADLRRVAEKLESTLSNEVHLHLLHGELPLAEQDAALRPVPAGQRKIVLSTAIAETSLTIAGVKVVIDGGFARVPRFQARTGFSTLETVPVSQAAADQRRGRAGRLGPGTCYRLWTTTEHDALPAYLPPEILTADLSSLALELALWGAAPQSLRWLDAPPAPALALANDLLRRLGAVVSDEGNRDGVNSETPGAPPTASAPHSSISSSLSQKPTPHGRALARLGLAPRLGHLVVRGHELGHGPAAAALAALLSERDVLRAADAHPTPPDLRLRFEAIANGRAPLPGLLVQHHILHRVRDAARNLRQRAGIRENATSADADAAGLLTALAYPDRVAQRETADRVRLATGQRVALPAEHFGRDDQFLAVAYLDGPPHQLRAALAAPVSRTELEELFKEQIEATDEVRWDAATGRVLARRRRRLGALVLSDAALPQPAPALVAAALLEALRTEGIARLPWSEAGTALRERLAFLHQQFPDTWPDVSDEALLMELEDWLEPHLAGLKSLQEVSRLDWPELLLQRLPGGWSQRQELDRLAPSHLEVPSGSRVALDYSDAAAPVLAVKLQEVFGLLDTPRVAQGRVPLTMHLLSPGGRPAQVTRDLRSFWQHGYFEVRKDLRGRYPKHPWPDDPLSAIPTKLTKKRFEAGQS